MSEAVRLADALDDTPNWQKESFGSDWKSGTMKFDSTPFEAAAELRRLHALNAELVEALRQVESIINLSPHALSIIRTALMKARLEYENEAR